MALSDYLELRWYGQAGKAAYDSAAGIDITSHIESLDKFTDVGTGETCSASIMLRAHGGNFVTEENGAADNRRTPIIKPFDLFKLKVTDDNDDFFERYLVQGRRSPQKTSMGQHITLDLHGREWWLQQITFPGRYYFRNFAEVVDEIIKFYNDWRAEKSGLKAYQPALEKDPGSGLFSIPSYTYGIFEFGDTISCYDALMEVVRRLELPVAAGGGGQHYGLRFVDKDIDTMQIQIYGRGSNGAEVSEDDRRPISYTEVREPPAATVVVVEGQEGAGTVPPQIALLRGYVEEWNNLPEWQNDVEYPATAFVRHKSLWYEAKPNSARNYNQEPVSGGNTFWADSFLSRYMTAQGEKGKDGINEIKTTNKFQYSPWTEQKAEAAAKNFMGNPTGSFETDATSVACPDMNLVVRADVVQKGRGWRTWVDCRASDEGGIPARLKYAAGTDRLYRGLRVLNDSGAPGGGTSFGAVDKFGTSTAGAVLARDRDGDWIVFKTPETFNEVAVLAEGRVYEYNRPIVQIAASGDRQRARTVHDARWPVSAVPGNADWRDLAGTLMGNDCFHYPHSIENAEGLVPLPDRSGGADAFLTDSAIEIEYHRNESQAVQATITSLLGKLLGAAGLGSVFNIFGSADKTAIKDDLTDAELDQLDLTGGPDQYNDGWWTVLFEAPFPKSTGNGIGETVGQIYGGGKDGLPKVPLFDAQNQTSTPTGKKGWTADDAEYLGQTSGIHFLYRFEITGPTWLSVPGNIPHSAIAFDEYDNVWRSRCALRFQRITQPLYLPWSSFSIYRARLPVALTPANYVQSVIKPELAVTETFDPRLIKRIIFQCDIGYDDEGRYDPWSWEAFVRKWATAIPAGDVVYKGTYDAFCFVRRGLAVSVNPGVGAGTLPRIDRRVAHPSISNAVQLRKIARAERDVAEHENDYISLKYERFCGLKAEQFFVITEPEGFIDHTNAEPGAVEGATGANTLKLICKKITYSVTGRAGAGGLIADVELFRKVANPREGALTRP